MGLIIAYWQWLEKMKSRITYWQFFIGIAFVLTTLFGEGEKFAIGFGAGCFFAFGLDSLKDHYIEWKKTR